MNAFNMNNIYYFHHFCNLRRQLFMNNAQNLACFLCLIMHGELMSVAFSKRGSMVRQYCPPDVSIKIVAFIFNWSRGSLTEARSCDSWWRHAEAPYNITFLCTIQLYILPSQRASQSRSRIAVQYCCCIGRCALYWIVVQYYSARGRIIVH